MGISGTFAITNQELDGAISTDGVNIEIQSLELNANNEEVEFGSNDRGYLPGDTIGIIPKVKNNGMDCYIRLKVNYVNDFINFLDYANGFSSGFEKHGEYYYYKDAVHSGDSIKIFDSIKVPNASLLDVDSGKLYLSITAEAIQEKNFEPDYTLEDPWNGIEPTKAINSSYNLGDEANIVVKYDEDLNNDINVPNDFLDDAKKMTPGDTYEDSIEIKNTNKDKAKYFMQFDFGTSGSKEIELLKQLDLVITNESGDVLYSGKFYNTDLMLIGEFAKGKGDKLNFKISVPIELGNEYANLNPKIIINFTSEYENKEKQEGHNVKTGDPIDLVTTIFLLSSIGLIIVMILYRRENKKIDENI